MSELNIPGFIAFLRGEVTIDGHWFGGDGPIRGGIRRNFWWREHLPKLSAHIERQDAEIAQLRADLSESRRLLDDALAQKPYAYEHGASNGDGTFSVHITRGDMEQIGPSAYAYCAPKNPHKDWPVKPLYAAPVPAQPAAVPEAVAKDAIPEGWVFHSADFSMQSCGAQDYGRVALIRDQDGRKWWHSLSDEAKESTELFYYGKGKTVALAIQNAVAAILSAADTEVKNG